MRSESWARWAACALAILIAIPVATADRMSVEGRARNTSEGRVEMNRGKKSLSTCTAFDQVDKDDDKVQFTIHNTCTVPVDCSISWRVVCAPESRKRRASHAGAAKLALGDASSQSTTASAAVCGDDGWAIDSIVWACEPSKE